MIGVIPGTESTWNTPPYVVHIGETKYDWQYEVTLDGEDFMEEDGFESEQDALRAAMAKLDKVDLARPPDYEDASCSMWWGPADDLADAESVTIVHDNCVSQYDFVGGYEGFEDDQWLEITTCLDDEPTYHPRALLKPGLDEISQHGGDEELHTDDELRAQWPENVVRKKNPAEIKRRMLDFCGYR